MRLVLKLRFDEVARRIEAASERFYDSAGKLLQRLMRAEIKTSSEPSQPGTPPHTRNGRLRRAIVRAVDGRGVLVGASHALMGPSAAAHEQGGRFRGRDYPARPFAGPALEEAAPELPALWREAIK